MADPVVDTQFVAGTVITSPWLNGVNDFVNDAINQTDYTKGAARIGFDNTTLTAFIRTSTDKVVASLTELRAVDKTKYTQAYVSALNGGGLYLYDNSDVISTDNGGTIIVASDGGRWKLTHTDLIDVTVFGAKGDGSTDDFDAITDAITALLALPTGGVLYFPGGRNYLTSAQLQFPKTIDKRIILEGFGAKISRHGSYTGSLAYFGEPVNLTSAPPVRVYGLTFAGPYLTPSVDPLVELQNSNGTIFIDCQFQSGTVGCILESSFAVSYHRCHFGNQSSFGLEMTTLCMQLMTFDCQFIDISVGSSGVALQFEAAALNVVVRDCDMEGGNSAMNFVLGGSNVLIDGCYIEGYTGVPIFASAAMNAFNVCNSWIGYNPGAQIWGNIKTGRLHNCIMENQQSTVDTTCEHFIIGNVDYRGTSNKTFTRMIPITLINGFSNTGGVWANAAWIKDEFDEVSFVGMVQAAGDNACFILPVGFRPTKQLSFACIAANRSPAQVVVFPDGSVTCYRGTDTTIDLAPVRFRVQQ